MSEIRALVEQLIVAGVDPIDAAEIITRAALLNAWPQGRTARQDRNRRYYEARKGRFNSSEKRLDKTSKTISDAQGDLPLPEGSSPKPPFPKPSPSISPSPPKGGSSPAGFDTFWAEFPNKVGKREAERSFARALQRADLQTILAGLRRYVAKTDDRPWCNPTTFLNQDRWTDQPATAPRRPASTAPPWRERTVLDALDDIAAGNFHHSPDPDHGPKFPKTIDASFIRRN